MKRLSIPLLAFSLMTTPALQAMDWFKGLGASQQNTLKIAAVGTVVVGAGYALGKFAYNKYKQYMKNRIIDESVEAVVLACTPNLKLSLLPEQARQDALRKKARLINIRKRVVTKLSEAVTHGSTFSSDDHRYALQKNMQYAETAFKLVDAIRFENPYEKEYTVASYVDTVVEKNVIDSLMLASKPDKECSSAELRKKQEIAQRREVILGKLKDRVSIVVLNKLISSTLVLQLLLA